MGREAIQEEDLKSKGGLYIKKTPSGINENRHTHLRGYKKRWGSDPLLKGEEDIRQRGVLCPSREKEKRSR